MPNSLKPTTLFTFILLIIFSLSSCQWGGNGDSTNDDTIIDGGSDSDVDIDIGTEAGDIFDIESNLHRFNFVEFQQDIADEKNSSYTLYFDSLARASSSIEPEDDQEQSTNDLTASQLTWWEELHSDTYSLQWLSINTPYNVPNSNYALWRPYQTLSLSGTNSGQLGNIVQNRNHPLVEAIDDNIFEHHLGMTFIWDLDGYEPKTIKKEIDLSNDDFSDYETLEGFDLLTHASIWGESENFSSDAKLYTGIKKVNTERVVIESQFNNSGNTYTIDTASFDATGKMLADIPTDYDNAGAARIKYTFTLNFISEQTLYISFDLTTQRAFYHLDETSTEIASSAYTLDSSLNLLTLNTQALTSLLGGGEDQATLLDKLNLTAFFNIAFVGPFTDSNNAEKFYTAKHFIASTEANSENQIPYFFFNNTAYNDIRTRFSEWRTEFVEDAY